MPWRESTIRAALRTNFFPFHVDDSDDSSEQDNGPDIPGWYPRGWNRYEKNDDPPEPSPEWIPIFLRHPISILESAKRLFLMIDKRDAGFARGVPGTQI